jgi:hypothetical protein
VTWPKDVGEKATNEFVVSQRDQNGLLQREGPKSVIDLGVVPYLLIRLIFPY